MRCQQTEKYAPSVSYNRMSRGVDSGFVNSSDFTSSDLELFVESIETIAKIERRKSIRGSNMSRKSDNSALTPAKGDSEDELIWQNIRTSTPYNDLMVQAQQIHVDNNLEANVLINEGNPLFIEKKQECDALVVTDDNAGNGKKTERMPLRKRIVNWLRRNKTLKQKNIQDDHLTDNNSELLHSSTRSAPRKRISLSCGLKQSFYGLFSFKRNNSVRSKMGRGKHIE